MRLGDVQMMKKVHDSIYVDRSPVFELFALIFRIGNVGKKTLNNIDKIEDDKLVEWLQEQQKSLSSDVLDEIDLFFHGDSFFGLSLTLLIYQNNKHRSIEE